MSELPTALILPIRAPLASLTRIVARYVCVRSVLLVILTVA
ncbi:MAG: hypothetical protein ACT4NP_03765 [Pseudonocardiales bacterium]